MTHTEANISEEPGAGKLHAGVCSGGVGQPASLPKRRYLALVYYHPTHSDYNAILTYGKLLNDELIERGHATRYDL